MKIKLEKDERIDDLQLNGLKIIQNTNGFCFGIDSILLSDFAKEIPENSKVLDLGTGTGIIATLLCEKTKLKKIYGIDVQEDVCKMAQKSVKLNNLEEKFEIINKNIKELEKIFEKNSIDAIVCNPPYKKDNSGIKNETTLKLISRHEITANLEDFVRITASLLKNNCSLYMVHRPERLVDLVCLLRKYNLEPKRLRMVQSYYNSNPKFFLIKATKNAKSFIDIQKPLIIYNRVNEYTDEILQIYGKEGK